MKARSSYKPTFLDRHGPDGAIALRAAGPAAMAGGLSLAMFGLAGTKLGLSGPALIAFTLVGALTLSGAAVIVAIRLGRGAGSALRYVMEGGSSTPYQEQFSQEQALVMQRDYAAAIALFEQRIAAEPNEPRVRIAAADLYATYGQNPMRAAELYREVQRIPDLQSGHDVYVANKLADLYLGPLAVPGRALVEFRRLIHRYPGSAAADHARRALANLKAEVVRRD